MPSTKPVIENLQVLKCWNTDFWPCINYRYAFKGEKRLWIVLFLTSLDRLGTARTILLLSGCCKEKGAGLGGVPIFRADHLDTL